MRGQEKGFKHQHLFALNYLINKTLTLKYLYSFFACFK